MEHTRQPRQVIADTQLAIDHVARSLKDTEGSFNRLGMNADLLLTRLQGNRADALHQAVRDQLSLAGQRPALPATEIAVDAATHFARQVWRRHNTV